MATPTNLRSAVMDPLLTYRFIVSWGSDGNLLPVAGVSKIGPLVRTTEKAEYGNNPSPVIPGQTKYEEINLERGIILDVAFEQCANQVFLYEHTGALGEGMSLADFRKDLTIDHCNQAGQVINRYFIFNCWPSKYSGNPELDAAAGNTVALESLTLQNEGWQRDDSFSPSAYPSFTEPSGPTGGLPPA